MYKLELTPRAQRELDKLRGQDLESILSAIQSLGNTPRPSGVRKLRGPIYRVRVGDWRIIHAAFDKDQLVIIGKVARRPEHTYDKVDELF